MTFHGFLREYITGVRVPGICEYIFNFTQSGQDALHNDCTNLQSHYMHENTTFIQPSPALVPSSYLISVNGMVLKWGLILFCMSLIPNKVNHPLIQLINIWVSISVNCLLNPWKSYTLINGKPVCFCSLPIFPLGQGLLCWFAKFPEFKY